MGLKTAFQARESTPTDRRTGRDTSAPVARTAPVFAHTISAQTKYLKPFSTSLLFFFSRLPFISKGGVGRSPTWSADQLGPSRRQTEQEQNLGQHSSPATRTTRVLRQLKVRERPAICWRGGWWGWSGLILLSMNKVWGLMVNPGHTFTCSLPLYKKKGKKLYGCETD